MATPDSLTTVLHNQGWGDFEVLPALTELHSGVVLTVSGGGLAVIDAQQNEAGEWKWIGYGPGIAFKEGRLGHLASLTARRAAQGIATRTEAKALGEISRVWVQAYLTGPHGEGLSPAEVDARILNEMDDLKARLALLSQTRAIHAEQVMDREADVRRTGVQTRAAEALNMSSAVLSRILSDAHKRRDKWTENTTD
jgi:hypothetical protein